MTMTMKKPWMRWAFLGAAMAVFAAAAVVFFRSLNMVGSPVAPIVTITLIFGGACAVFLFGDRTETDWLMLLLGSAVIAGLLMARFCMLPYPSNDYNAFLSNWVNSLKNAPGLTGLGLSVGDYNAPYLYVLFVIAKAFPTQDMYFIKLFSVLFDVVLAYVVWRIVSRSTEKPLVRLLAFAGTLALPTVMLNGAYWGQCDSVYAALVLACFLYATEDKPIRSCILLGLAFSFKLQTVFFFPVFLLLVLLKKIDVMSLLVAPITFAATLIPTLLAGRGLAETLSIYVRQTDTYHYLVMNAPTVFRLFGYEENFEILSAAGLFFAGTAVAALLAVLWKFRDGLDTVTLADAALVFAIAMPFFLPRMHDRYFFLADVLSFVYAFHHPKRWYVALMVVFASYTAYYHYLFGGGELIEPAYSAIIMAAALALTVYDLVKAIYVAPQKRK